MTNLETAARAALEAMKAVVSGNMGVPRDRRDRTCAHGRFFWEDCGQCVDEHLAPHIAALEAALAAPGVDPAAIRRAALEEAARVANAFPASYADGPSLHVENMTCARIAAAIRALADKEPTDG